MGGTSSDVTRIAAEQRTTNARRATGALCLLTVLATLLVAALHGATSIVELVAFSAAGQGVAYWLVKTGRTMAAVLFSSACIYAEHIGVVAIQGALGPVPHIASIVMLLCAATAEASWLPASFASCLVVLGVEGWLSPWAAADQQAIATAALFATLVFVVSLLHVRGTEHAFALAERQDRARAGAAAAAIESERRYRLIADSTDDLIGLVDPEGKALYLSPSHHRVLGLEVERAMGRPVAEFLELGNRPAAREAFTRALATGQGRVELSVRRANGALRIVEARMTRVEGEQTPLVAVIGRDVTEQRDLEQRLQASERLEALGRLAGSVAHDFNNLLTVIGGASELARGELGAGHPARAELDGILAATSTAADLARQLLTFSRKQLVTRTRLEVPAVLEEQREVLARMAGHDVRLEYDFEGELPAVMMPRTHLEQLAMNLTVNARDAMPEGGRLRFVLRRRTLRDREVGDLVAGAYLQLEVRDEGVGIPANVLPHVFEPFFSTKGTQGTGLGLATCFGIVAQAGGTIDVESAAGKGTVFRVLLPAADAGDGTAGAANVGSVRRVLVVDDDPSVQRLTTRILRAEGYEVHTASTLAEARAIIGDESVALDAMLTDVVLGEERGTDLVEDCRRTRPSMRIVVTSGYAPDAAALQSVAASGASFLPKPFRRDQLLALLRGDAAGEAAAVTGTSGP